MKRLCQNDLLEICNSNLVVIWIIFRILFLSSIIHMQIYFVYRPYVTTIVYQSASISAWAAAERLPLHLTQRNVHEGWQQMSYYVKRNDISVGNVRPHQCNRPSLSSPCSSILRANVVDTQKGADRTRKSFKFILTLQLDHNAPVINIIINHSICRNLIW